MIHDDPDPAGVSVTYIIRVLGDRSSRPHRSPRRLDEVAIAAILRTRSRRRYGPARLAPLTGHPRSTIYGVLRRAGLSRLRDTDRVTTAPVRYVACHPGALVHQDHNKLGRVPDGWRVLGRGRASQDRPMRGYDHLEVFIDDASRCAVVVPVADERGASAAWALEVAAAHFAEAGIRIERMLTDNGASYRSGRYRDVLAAFDIRHKRTRPFRPQTNGKAERFIRTLLDEWAYARPYRSNPERADALGRYVDFYDHGRPHTAIGDLVPRGVVNDVLGHHNQAPRRLHEHRRLRRRLRRHDLRHVPDPRRTAHKDGAERPLTVVRVLLRARGGPAGRQHIEQRGPRRLEVTGLRLTPF